jgi:hypothetical protein
MAWLDGAPGRLVLRVQGRTAPVERIARAGVAQRFGFQRLPAP